MDDSLRRVNGQSDVSTKAPPPSSSVAAAPGRYGGHVYTSEDAAPSHASSAHSSNEEEEEREEEEREEEEREEEEEEKGVVRNDDTPATTPQPPPEVEATPPAPESPAPPAKETANQESYCDMRISLNQKPNSSKDFGFHADWDSTGAHITYIQPGTCAEQCQLQVGDEVLAVSGQQVADMSYAQWKSSQQGALQLGSLTMDVRRHGRNTWDREHAASLPFKSHKTINLTSMDHPTVSLGGADAPTPTINTTGHHDYSWKSRGPPPAQELAKDPAIDQSNGLNGGFPDEPVTMRSKDSEPISLKNLKRRSEFFEKGGSESAISDLAVPSIAPPASRWSWDPEEERRRQEKWQREQERLLQEKYKRDQEKLEEEWLKAQQDATGTQERKTTQELVSVEVEGRSASPSSPLSPLSQPPSPWEEQGQEESRALEEEEVREEEERRRRREREEQEQRRQEEERRRRAEEERELRRLQEERRRRELQEEEERRAREEEERRWQRKREEEREEARRRQEEAEEEERRRETEERGAREQQWGGECYGYAQVHPELTMADRVKSKSTPQLDEMEKPERRVAGGEPAWGRDHQKRASLSVAEAERQQIIQEMKKKTHLLTDSSWIRQRSSSTAAASKEPPAGHIRRGESLDNLDQAPRSSWRSSWTPGSSTSSSYTSTHIPNYTSSHIPNYSRPHSSSISGAPPSYTRPGSSSTLPSSYSMSSLRLGAGNPTSSSSSWSQRSPSPTSPSPTSSTPSSATSPEPTASEARPPPSQRGRSVSGKKMCTLCDTALGKGAAMIIESLGLCYHLSCFKCIDCKCDLGGSEAGAEVRIRNRQLYCNSCYVRVKSGQPTSM